MTGPQVSWNVSLTVSFSFTEETDVPMLGLHSGLFVCGGTCFEEEQVSLALVDSEYSIVNTINLQLVSQVDSVILAPHIPGWTETWHYCGHDSQTQDSLHQHQKSS